MFFFLKVCKSLKFKINIASSITEKFSPPYPDVIKWQLNQIWIMMIDTEYYNFLIIYTVLVVWYNCWNQFNQSCKVSLIDEHRSIYIMNKINYGELRSRIYLFYFCDFVTKRIMKVLSNILIALLNQQYSMRILHDPLPC